MELVSGYPTGQDRQRTCLIQEGALHKEADKLSTWSSEFPSPWSGFPHFLLYPCLLPFGPYLFHFGRAWLVSFPPMGLAHSCSEAFALLCPLPGVLFSQISFSWLLSFKSQLQCHLLREDFPDVPFKGTLLSLIQLLTLSW